ncbi:MAG: hypothetical protein K2J40_00160 [Ruminococcus sp.]|nr:hypothetical protein [Ruminococcus sp.]
MSNRIGVIISAEVTENILDNIRQKYGFQLIPVENPTLSRSLEKNERFYDLYATIANTGIGRYEQILGLYTDMEECIKIWGFDTYYRTITETNENYLIDADRWVNIIKDLRYNYRIRSVGIINFYADRPACDMDFPEFPRRRICTADITAFTMMNLDFGTIYIFV